MLFHSFPFLKSTNRKGKMYSGGYKITLWITPHCLSAWCLRKKKKSLSFHPWRSSHANVLSCSVFTYHITWMMGNFLYPDIALVLSFVLRCSPSNMGAAGEGPGSSENGGARPGGLHPEPQQEGHRTATAAAAQQVQNLHVPWYEAERGLPPRCQLHFCPLAGRAWEVSICPNAAQMTVFATKPKLLFK